MALAILEEGRSGGKKKTLLGKWKFWPLAWSTEAAAGDGLVIGAGGNCVARSERLGISGHYNRTCLSKQLGFCSRY